MIRSKREPNIIDQSVGASCAIIQKPEANIGIFVVAIATNMSMINGMTASLVKSPTRM
jgi:hypothetical protein